MVGAEWLKATDTLVLRRRDGGHVLVDPEDRLSEPLTALESSTWVRWTEGQADPAELGTTLERLERSGFVTRRRSGVPNVALNVVPEGLVLRVNDGCVRSYKESPDLTILFHTAATNRQNPLLSLGPYASFCWQGVVEQRTVRSIQVQAMDIFGIDEVIPFLARLMRLGFLAHEPALDLPEFPSEPTHLELRNARVQSSILHAAVPWYCLWETNTTCDLHCGVCYQQEFSNSGVDPHTARALASQIIDSGALYVSLFGGESLLRPDLESLVAELRQGRVYVKLITNGVKLSLQRAESLKASGLNHLEVSFDGLSAEVHEQSRGAGNFAAAKQAIENARRAGIPRLGTVLALHSGNLNEVPTLPQFMRSLGVEECYLSPFKKTGLAGANAPWLSPSPGELAEVNDHIEEWRVSDPDLTMALLPGCTCGRTSVVISADAKVRPCSFSPMDVGSLLAKPLKQIWQDLEQLVPETGPFGYCQAATTAATSSVRLTELRR